MRNQDSYRARRRALVAALGTCLALAIGPATYGDITIPIPDVGTITVHIDLATPDFPNYAIEASFVAAGGQTLAQLEHALGQDHLNWFQKVLSIDPPIPGITPPFVDPPSGGLGPQWHDNIPWYWDEFLPSPVPPGKTADPIYLLANHISSDGTALGFEDQPGNFPVGTGVNFATFLISDYGNHTYQVLGQGFTWTATIDPNGHTVISNLAGGASFTSDYATEISTNYPNNFRQIPEPSSLALCGFGAIALAGCARWTRRSARA
jgi:hypothetical protein